MNIWWLIITPMSLGWLVPMFVMRKAGTDAAVYVILALLWSVVAWRAEPLYDWGTNMGKKRGHTRIVALRERLKDKVLPPAKTALVIMALISLCFAFSEYFRIFS